ncbi:MAG: hypothetical protein ACXVW2_17145 [Nocardioidaceae bacterium]
MQLHREGSRSAGTKALDIDYTVDGRPGTLRIPFTIRLCAPGDTSGHCGP